MFYFDKISFLEHVLKPIISPKRKFNQSSFLPRNVFYQSVSNRSRNKPFCRDRVVEKQNEMNGDVPVSDMRHAFRAA